MYDLAVIGGGFSGTMAAVQAILRSKRPIKIALVEKNPQKLFKGTAYGTIDPNHLLNVPAGKMSAFPDKSNHFVEWLVKNEYGAAEEITPRFMPRKVYGAYIADILEQILTARPDCSLDVYKDEALNLKAEEGCAVIKLMQEGKFKAKHTLLALGNFPPKNPPLKGDAAIYESDGYIENPWQLEKVHEILPDQDILIVGTGLTMIDMLVTLSSQLHAGQIYALSRRGLVPHMHQNHEKKENPFKQKQEKLLSKQLKLFKAAITDKNWRGSIDALRSQTQILWAELDLVQKKRFLKHLRPYWDVHRHRVAMEIAQIMEDMSADGQFELLKGYIQETRHDGQNFHVSYKPRGSEQLEMITVQKIINCTGPNHNIFTVELPLINQMAKDGIIHQDDVGLGYIIDDQYSGQVSTIGGAQIGSLWETTAVPELKGQAEEFAKRLHSELL